MDQKKPKPRKTATIILRVAPDLLKRVDRIGAAEFEGRSATVRRALEVGLRRLESKGK